MSFFRPLVATVLSLSASCIASVAQSGQSPLADLSLEDVAQTKILVSSVSRKEEDVDAAPAAVFVISRDDIARSSADSIPDLLRVVPGLQVAQITASTWAVSARGFNSAFADKLLVLIDGRTVYSEVYSGVHWDEIDMPLQNIDRIEIIRGPGAAVWGANAANGVINIITRPAREWENTSTLGEFSRISGKALVQRGGSLGDRLQYRGFLSYIDRRALADQAGNHAFDGSSLIRTGGRLDYQRSASQAISLLGDVYRGHLRQQVGPFLALPLESGGREHDSIAGGFAQGAWLISHGESSTNVQSYYVDETRNELASKLRTRTADLDVVNHRRTHGHVDLVWGGEARYTHDRVSGVAPTQRPTYDNYLVSGFLQADVMLKPQVLTATFGTKVQTGTLTGVQLQPSVRLLWVVNNRSSFWTAVSRAVVAPSLQDKAINLPLNLGVSQGLPVVGNLRGNWAFKPEEVIATEGGYRQRLDRTMSADLALYVNESRRLRSLETGAAAVVLTPMPHITVDELYTNGYSALSGGIEVGLAWKPRETLQVHGSYGWMQAQTTQTGLGQVQLIDAFASAKNTASADLFWAVNRAWSLNAQAYRVGNVRTPNAIVDVTPEGSIDGSVDHVPAFTRCDLNVKRKVGSSTVLQVGGTNLLQPRHLEFGSETSFVVPHYVPRSVFVRASWSF